VDRSGVAYNLRIVSKHVIIVGGGVGGLAAAVRLAAVGVRVTLLEKNARVGGKLNLWVAPHPNRPAERPFRFDTGPSLLTMPFVFDQLFEAAGTKLSDHLHVLRLDPIARYVWPDGSTFEARARVEDVEDELKRFAPQDLRGWQQFARRGKEIWDLAAGMFLFNAPEQLLRGKTDPKSRAGAGLAMLTVPLRIGMFAQFNRLVNQHVSNRKLREILYQYATYSGASPFKAPATLACIPHAEFEFGGWYIEGGMYRLAEALERLARSLGAEIHTNAPVSRILIEDRGHKAHATGVRLENGEQIRADAVVANSDVVYTYRNLIDSSNRIKYNDNTLDKLEPGGSGMVLMLGVEGTYPQLAHHNKLMPIDYRSDLKAMFERQCVPEDPCIYVCASTRTDPSQAPDGCENLFVLASAPALGAKIDWGIESHRYRDQLVRTLETRFGLKNLNDRIVVERCLTPVDLQDLYNANRGTIYGIGSNSRRTAFLRPPNRDRDVKSLYFAGGATHPGGGLPLVALSGKIVSEMVLEDFGVTSPTPANITGSRA